MSMHHIYTGSKGDPLCPLGFHPQVRWPTRCKRCFRDYKEHGGKGAKDSDTPSIRKDDTTMSTPSLSTWSSRHREDSRAPSVEPTPIVSSTSEEPKTTSRFSSRPSSWTSTPDLSEADAPTVSITLPRRRATADLSANLDAATRSTEFTVRRRTSTSSGDLTKLDDSPSVTTTIRSRNTSPFVSKTTPKEESPTKLTTKAKVSSSTNTTEHLVKKPAVVENKKVAVVTQNSSKPPGKTKKEEKPPEVEFILKVKQSNGDNSSSKKVIRQTSSVLIPPHGSSSSSSSDTEHSSVEDEDDDKTSIAGSETTETTLVNPNENLMQDEIDSLKMELETVKARCDKAEREKSDLLLRRLASYDTTPTKHTASEVLKLQQKVNEMTAQLEDLRDEKKSLSLKVRELEADLEKKSREDEISRRAEELQGKLTAAETLCEELMDENEDIKKELRELEDEIEEVRDNFREDQAEEYSGLRKELQQTTKNCRILSFKLRKSERRTEELETEKLDLERRYKEAVGGQKGVDNVERLKKLEGELSVANEVASRLTKELEEAKAKLKSKDNKEDPSKKKPPMLGSIPKITSGEKVSRASLTRGGSQEDPQQLLRDLQDSMEREADLREQLKFAEEEAAKLRKMATRVDEENDSLALQLKKMATKAKSGRRRSPTPNRLTPEPFVEKDEGISEEEDPAELRLMLELNEQETGILRKKVEQLESELEEKKRKIKEMDEQLSQRVGKKGFGLDSWSKEPSLLEKEKMKVVEEECGELRKKLIDKERENERLQNEVQLAQRKKGTLVKSKSLDSGNEQQALDLKRQLQLVEQEANILRTKTQTLETENDKLSAENRKLQLLRGTKKLSNSSESIAESVKLTTLEAKLAESEKKVNELKEKLEKAETSAKKVPFGKSTELEKVKKDLKTKTEEAEKLTKEVETTKECLRRLRDDAVKDIANFYKSRSPKRPTDMTTKLQMKKMVDELENEIGDILIALQKSCSESSKESVDDSIVIKKDKQIKELEEKLESFETQKTFKIEKDKIDKSLAEERDKLKKLEGERKAMESAKKKLEAEIKKLQTESESWKIEKKNMENLIEELNNEKKNSTLAQNEVAVFMKKLDKLTRDLENERETTTNLKEKLASVNKLEEEKLKLQKEVTDRNKQILDFDRKLRESEGKVKRLEMSLATGKTRIAKLEKTLEDQESGRLEKEERWRGLQDELNGFEALNESQKSKIAELEESMEKKNESIRNLEDSLRKERERATDATLKAGSAEKREITLLRKELSEKIEELDEINSKCEELEKKRKDTEGALLKEQSEMKKEAESMSKKLADLEVDLNAEKQKSERMKATHDKELKNRETELTTLKLKIRNLEQSSGDSSKRVTEVREELNNKVKKVEAQLARERQNYEDLTVKYELLEEEHVVTKAQMVMEKEKIQNQLAAAKREGESLTSELTTLKETYSSKQDSWIKEKIDLQEELKETIERLTRNSESKWELEKSRLISMHEEQQSIADGFKARNEAMEEQMDHMRKENEDMRKKLIDFEKVEKVHRQLAAESDKLEAELKEVRTKLGGEDKSRKAELAAQKLRYESRVNLITEELQSSQSQLSRFKRERDAYRHMLEEAQAQMVDLKSGLRKDSRPSSTTGDEEEAKETIAALEQQLSVMEDELSEARLEASKLKTELVSEKSAWEVKISELQSKVNALEEDKILASGRTKIPGLRTRMELAWAKEREDQQRLLQETSTLARDLRQTLFEVERERDKERLEAKRRHDHIKNTSEEELEENRKKITELQCDLLELRDAHAKLRTTNEKLRREREKGDREMRAQMRARRTDEEERRLNGVMEQIETFMRYLPEFLDQKAPFLELPPGYRLQHSREPSPLNPNEDYAKLLQLTLQRLYQAVVDMRGMRDAEDRSRRSVSIGFGNRRAGSSEPESESSNGLNRVQRKPSLYRKSLSLSETTGPTANDQAIWKDEQDGSIDSLQSIESHVNTRLQNMGKRESSMDSRLSGGSTQSEMIGDQKKKKGLFGKLKKLTKSSKSEDTGSHGDVHAFKSVGGSDSDMSMAGDIDVKGSKTDLKGKLSGIFKKGTSSRGNSVERTLKPEDGSKTLPRSTKSPAKSTVETKSSTLGRTLDRTKNPTVGMYRK